MKKPDLNKVDKIKKHPLGTEYRTYKFFDGRVRLDKVFRYMKYEKRTHNRNG